MDWSSSLEVRTPLGHAQCSPSEHFDAFHPSKKQRLSPLSVTDDAATQFNPTYQGLCGTTKLSETAGENPQYQPCVEQQNVCFGMIYGFWASNSDEGQHVIPGGPSLSTANAPGRLSLSLGSGDLCFLTSTFRNDTRSRIGVLDVRTARGLNALSTIESVRFNVFLLADDVPSKSPVSRHVKRRLAINVNGSVAAAGEVGCRLSKAKLYLQQPDALEDGVSYENPHLFKSESQTSTDIPEPVPVAGYELEDEIVDIFDSLSGGPCGTLSECEIDSRITTQLLGHQKRGVAFMTHIETRLPDLWKQGSSSSYQHIITGLKTTTLPDVTRGGILADAMGLGKSLTTLATVLGSLDCARGSVGPQTSAEADGPEQRYPTKSTLIVVPLSLLSSWIDEIQKHVAENSISVYEYYGPSRIRNPTRLREFDIILTSYNTVAYEHSKDDNVLGRLNFFRVVLDEAHIIRNQQSRLFLAINQLSSKRRWCLTGTPMQNGLGDLESLFKFIRLSPFDRGRDFQTFVTGPLKNGESSGVKNLSTLLRSICLRRSTDVLETLPRVSEMIRTLELSPQERTQYTCIIHGSIDEIDALTCAGNSRKACQSILKVILRLRRLCNHGTSGVSPREPSCELAALESQFGLQPSTVCSQCNHAIEPSSGITNQEGSTTCCHIWCQNCFALEKGRNDFTGGKRKKKTVICPLCGCPVTSATSIQAITAAVAGTSTAIMDSDYSSQTEMDFSFDNAFSTKITAVVNDIESSQDKGIVFSLWTKTLDGIENALASRGMSCMRLDGSLTGVARAAVIQAFHNDSAVKTLLMTTGVGATGFNLAIASRIHIVEPQWNPTVELQAIGRAHRLGQKKSVTVFRYIMKDTIEESVKKLGSMKLQLSMLALGAHEDDTEAQTMNRLQSLRTLF